MITEISIQAGIRNPADREGGESSNSAWEHLGGLKGCELSLNQPDCGIMEQAGRLAEMCAVRPGRANPLGQESAEGLGFFGSEHFKKLPSSLKCTGEGGEWSEP